MKRISQILLLVVVVSWVFSCRQRSPENLPKHKERFKTQIASFDKEKDKTNQEVKVALDKLSGLQRAINDAQKVDKEFNRVYTAWHQVNKKVTNLYDEYEDLKARADTLFTALDRQIESLNDEKNKSDLKVSLLRAKNEYQKTLANTEVAINKLKKLHAEAIDIIKALEAAVAIGQIAQINEGLKSIQNRVDGIMQELNITVEESQKLYNNRLGGLGGSAVTEEKPAS